MRGHGHIRRSLVLLAALAVFVLGGVSAAAADTVSGGYTGGESVQGSVDRNPAPPAAVAAAPTPAPAGRLAFTGSDTVRSMAALGGGLLVAGSIAVVAGRARRESSGAT